MVRRLSAAAQTEVERTVRRKGVVAVGEARCVVRVGEAAVELVDVAEREGSDLIVVGRGRGGQLGPVAERLVRMAGRAVLVAPSKGPTWITLLPGASLPIIKKRRSRAAARA
jgi:nucleotide-binding universal stress UspA family protein